MVSSTSRTVGICSICEPKRGSSQCSLCTIRVDLDRSNVSNAYVSGMREELSMHGTQFNVSTSLSSLLLHLPLGRGTEVDALDAANKHHLHLRLHRGHDTK